MNYLLLPHLKVLNANANSSTYTVGFPAMTAFMGVVHALQRKITQEEKLKDIRFSKMAVSCHSCNLRTYKETKGYDSFIIGTRNPLEKEKNFGGFSFIEEARINLDVSLLIQCKNIHGDDGNLFLEKVQSILPKMKLAGGDIISFGTPKFSEESLDDQGGEKNILYQLMPGYVLIERRNLMEKAMIAGLDGIDALLSYTAVEHKAEENGQGIRWKSKRKVHGWIVPIAVGFKGITPLGRLEEQRDLNTLHQFAEPLVTLGEFIMPYRFNHIADILWHYEYDENQHLYICKNEQ